MVDQATIEREVIAALRTCYDPEIPVDIYELGLIYAVTVAPEGTVHIRMTLTSPNCPAAQELPPMWSGRCARCPASPTPGSRSSSIRPGTAARCLKPPNFSSACPDRADERRADATTGEWAERAWRAPMTVVRSNSPLQDLKRGPEGRRHTMPAP